MSSVGKGLDRIERDIAYLRGVVEQLDKRFSEFREYVDRRFEALENLRRLAPQSADGCS